MSAANRQRNAILAELLPSTTAAAEAFHDDEGATLFPQEAAIVEGAVDKRRAAFRTGRACAHRALKELGVAPTPILVAKGGAPRWPSGVVGSITHCDGYRAAAVAWAADLASIGIDAEPNEPLPERVFPRVALEREQAMVQKLALAKPDVCWDRLLFSAKEAVYKAYYSLTGRPLSFSQATILFDAEQRKFSVELPNRAMPAKMDLYAQWIAINGLVATAVAVQPPEAIPPNR